MSALVFLGLLTLAVVTGSLIGFAKLRISGERSEKEHFRALWVTEQECRRAYERALGLPFYDEAALEHELWARAAQGDEQAEEILTGLYAAKLRHGSQSPPEPIPLDPPGGIAML